VRRNGKPPAAGKSLHRLAARLAPHPAADDLPGHDPPVHDIKAGDHPDHQPEGLSGGWGVFPRKIMLAIRTALGLFEDFPLTVWARDARFLIVVVVRRLGVFPVVIGVDIVIPIVLTSPTLCHFG